MIDILLARWQQGHRTIDFPRQTTALPDRYRGMPAMDSGRCPAECTTCLEECPTGAMARRNGTPAIDLGACLFCGACQQHCPGEAVAFTNEFRMAASTRDSLVTSTRHPVAPPLALSDAHRRLFRRSLKLRQVSAGGCNACEADTNVLNTLVFDLGRFGVQFVASPRHADGLLITGPVTRNMEVALRKTWDAEPAPKLVIAVGACAISGGIYGGHSEVLGGAPAVLPVDIYIPGCPPHPLTILDGIVRALKQKE